MMIEDNMDPNTSEKRKAETDLETSKEKQPKLDPEPPAKKDADLGTPQKKAMLIGLKHPDPKMMKGVDTKEQILRVKEMLTRRRGFPESNITLMIQDGDDQPGNAIPTAHNIRNRLFFVLEGSNAGDILYIHIIAHGCSDGLILATGTRPVCKHVSDCYFRSVIFRAIEKGCNLTLVSDCLIEPIYKCPCPKIMEPINPEVFTSEKKPLKFLHFVTEYQLLVRTTLSPVDLNSEHDKTESKEEKVESSGGVIPPPPPSPIVVLLTPFQCDRKALINDILASEVFIPSPKGAASQQTYGGFTNAILKIMDDTKGKVTNLELARMATERLPEITPELSCKHQQHATASFVC